MSDKNSNSVRVGYIEIEFHPSLFSVRVKGHDPIAYALFDRILESIESERSVVDHFRENYRLAARIASDLRDELFAEDSIALYGTRLTAEFGEIDQ